MLQHLSVQNYALIEHLEIDFAKGLTTITGETGAGKSILMGALSLIAGQRADTQVLQDKTRKCLVEGIFYIKEYKLEPYFQVNELDYSDTCIIRREINPAGNSRAFINDTPVNLNQLKELSSQLLDIHSQHETLRLNDSDFQLSVVDTYAKQLAFLKDYKKIYNQVQQFEAQLRDLREKEEQSKKDKDYFQFLFNELHEADLDPFEQSKLEEELKTLEHAEEIKLNLNNIMSLFSGSDTNVLNQLNEIKQLLSQSSKYHLGVEEALKRFNSSLIELKDISKEVESIEEKVNYDPKRLEFVNDRLNRIYQLQQKHQLKTIEGLLILKGELSGKLVQIDSMEEDIQKLEKTLQEFKSKAKEQAQQLSANRTKAIPEIEKRIVSLLVSLGMPDSRLKIKQEIHEEKVGPNGIDEIGFLFTANKGSDLKELNKIASGGELSRVMLCTKSLLADLISLPTIIFDEIDTGVSGDVANKVGQILLKMAATRQVISITHLPQIASKGNSHLFVYKEVQGDKTQTRIRILEKKERILEIAKMLSTETPTSSALKNAEELLSDSV